MSTPPPEVAAAAKIVREWLDKEDKPAGVGAEKPASAIDRFNAHRMAQHEAAKGN